MKPNFALSLSFESIRLLHRVSGGWRLIGEVSPQSDELAAELAMLRKTATTMAPDGLRCKLVIPNEQIRYLSVATPGQDLAERRDAARDALATATPYALDDLAFDISAQEETTHVAAVALETLREAEDFAAEHRFHPVSFVAIPDGNSFGGEPYFGPARGARDLLGPGHVVEPDPVAIELVGDIALPEGPVVTGPEADAPPVQETPSPVAPTFKSARQTEAEQASGLQGALASLRANALDGADVIAPDLPSRDVEETVASFSSRRGTADPTPPVYDTPPRAWNATAGFAEPAEPFVPKPAGPARPRSVRVPLPAAEPVTTKAANEAERLTVFGAREADTSQSGRRRVPMGLVAALVVVLAGVGSLSFGSLQDRVADWRGDAGSKAPEITAVEVAPPIQPDISGQVDPAPDETDLALLESGLTDEDAAVLDALRTPLVEDDTPVPSPEDARASYAVTGIWPQAPEVPSPPAQVDIENLYVTSIDPIEPAFDAVALPPVASLERDIIFDPPASPAAAGTEFALDARGLVVATNQGALNPDGVKIFAGAPPVRPAAIPSRDLAAVAADPVQTELAGFRPRTRPTDLVETTERATLDGLTRSELAELRPPARPTPSPATVTAATASLVQLDEGGAPFVAPGAGPVAASNSRLALAASRRPDARPSNFNQIVARAQRTAASAAAVATASIAPRSVAPRIPSSASVAREATVRNAINLRRVNLIGVYGTPSDRRALVRLANGRYKKVQVGDRIDGGRISAIGEGELRYQKSGRNIVLKMPQG